MSETARILVVDDVRDNVDILETRLRSLGYDVLTASDGEAAIAAAHEHRPDMLLLDVMMPGLDGLEVTRRLKADKSLPFMPIILVTARGDSKDVVSGFNAGADDYLTKPVDHAALQARVRSMIRIKRLQDSLTALNRELEIRVRTQVDEIARISRLKRFLPPQLAEAIVSSDGEAVLRNHRRDIVALFCDLRGFTSFAETAEPEDIMRVLSEYHGALGPLIHKHEGTLDRFAGDGILVFFNDPVPCEDAPLRVARLATEMRSAVMDLQRIWGRRGHALGFGIGAAQGFATLGQIGFSERLEYTAIGAVVNLAARLCDQALDGQILVSDRLASAVESKVDLISVGNLQLRGFSKEVPVWNVGALKN